MELSTFVASQGYLDVIQSNLWNQVDLTDAPCKVKLVKVPFVAVPGIDEVTIPAATEFAELTSGTPGSYTDGSGRIIFSLPDPAGGWNFVSGAGTYPLTVYGFRVEAADGTFLGCGNIPQQNFTATGQHCIIGAVQLRELTNYFAAPGAEN